MTALEINLAVAEACPATAIITTRPFWRTPVLYAHFNPHDDHFAIHAAIDERILVGDFDLEAKFISEMDAIHKSPSGKIDAPPNVLCEAFLRTLGLWKERP